MARHSARLPLGHLCGTCGMKIGWDVGLISGFRRAVSTTAVAACSIADDDPSTETIARPRKDQRVALLARWSARYDWPARADAYDMDVERKVRKATTTGLVDSKKRQLKSLQRAQAVADGPIVALSRAMRKAKASLRPIRWTSAVCVALERLDNGEEG